MDAAGVGGGVVCIQCRRNGQSVVRAEPEYYSGAMDETSTMDEGKEYPHAMRDKNQEEGGSGRYFTNV